MFTVLSVFKTVPDIFSMWKDRKPFISCTVNLLCLLPLHARCPHPLISSLENSDQHSFFYRVKITWIFFQYLLPPGKNFSRREKTEILDHSDKVAFEKVYFTILCCVKYIQFSFTHIVTAYLQHNCIFNGPFASCGTFSRVCGHHKGKMGLMIHLTFLFFIKCRRAFVHNNFYVFFVI